MLCHLQDDESLLGANGLRILAGIQSKSLIFNFLSQHTAAKFTQRDALGGIGIGGRGRRQVPELCPRR